MSTHARRSGEGQVFLGSAGASLETRAAQLATLYRLTDPALSELGLEPLLHEVLQRVHEILEVDTVAVLLLDEAKGELVARAAKGIEEEVRAGVRIPLGRGFAGRIAAERAAIFIPDVEHADVLNPILREKGICSLLGVPLITEARVVGVLHVGSLAPRLFTNDDAAVLQLAAARVAPAIERADLFDQLEREHRAAVALQRSMLPDRLPRLIGVDTAGRYFPARDEVGGDWYDVLELPRGQVGIAIGDVAGHGVRAAALMGQLRIGLRAYALDGHGPGAALERVARLLHTIRGRGMATAAYAVLDPDSGEVVLAAAGHPPPLVVGPDGARIVQLTPAPPLGAVAHPHYLETRTTLQPGETLLLYTDGLVERRGEVLGEGLERLRASAAASGARSAEALCTDVCDALIPEGAMADDVAVVALRNLPLGPRLELRLPADPTTLASVRRALRRWLISLGAGDDDLFSVTLAVGEACANAIEHAYAPDSAWFDLEASHEDGVVTVAVRDRGRWRASRGSNRGRGLGLMEAMMDDVSIDRSDDGSSVTLRRRLRG